MGIMSIYYDNPEKYPAITKFLANEDEELGPVEYTGEVSKEPPALFPEYFNLEKLEKDNEQARNN